MSRWIVQRLCLRVSVWMIFIVACSPTAADAALPNTCTLPDLTGYRLTFDDEFNNLSASPNGSDTTWETKYWWGGRSLGSNDYYLDPSTGGLGQTPFSISNGVLNIHAQTTTRELQAAGVTSPFTTGQIDTHNFFSQEYGYFEMRAKMSATYGTNNAFWLMPMSGPWPPEIDISEVLGRDPETNFMTNHTDSSTPTSFGGTAKGVDLSVGYHTYGLMWTPTTITFYLDGITKYTTATQHDEHQSMYILVTLGVGGPWPGNPSNPSNFSADMKIDYIRAYSNNLNVTATEPQRTSEASEATSDVAQKSFKQQHAASAGGAEETSNTTSRAQRDGALSASDTHKPAPTFSPSSTISIDSPTSPACPTNDYRR